MTLEPYFRSLKEGVDRAYGHAAKARAKGYDPEPVVEVALAANLAERVIGLISVVAPQLRKSGIVERILKLEEEFGKLDWRVAFTVALEVAQEKYCTFPSKIEAIETGIRVGFAYVTVGVVSAPIEGFTKLELKRRNDGEGEYFSIYYSGPIRNAGGTAAAVSVLIADYVRKHLGYAAYDPTEKEVLRCHAELEDYHSFITNLQYFPSKEECEFLLHHIPVEINGDESEKYEVSNVNLKDLPRIAANKLRNGYCLIHSSCIPLKAPKLWAKLEKWGPAFGMEHWSFLKDFISLQKRMKAQGKKEESARIAPDYTYIQDLVAGRPVFAHPMRPGGWRLRYGRSRASGYSGQAIHPASMVVLQDFLATGTQLKTERPGKAAAFCPCDTIEGPIILLADGSVKRLDTEAEARRLRPHIKEVLYLGDVLVNYGDFFDRAHTLVPAGYCEEYWLAELEHAAMSDGAMPDMTLLATETGVDESRLQLFSRSPHTKFPSFDEAARIATTTKTPLHPRHTLFWRLLGRSEMEVLVSALIKGRAVGEKFLISHGDTVKRILETLGVEHTLSTEDIILDGDAARQVLTPLGLPGDPVPLPEGENGLSIVSGRSPFMVRDKAGLFIGSRMGRPEKAKMRKMTGSPHVLFPVGEEGGRLRSFQAALQEGKVTSAFPVCHCDACGIVTPFFRCERCDRATKRLRHCATCGTVEECPHNPSSSSVRAIDIRSIFNACLRKMATSIFPDLIKGVRGTSNSGHVPEHPIKGILRAKHDVYVNKDGTIRYDASEITLTHFKPKEVGVPPERLRELGYEKDIHGKSLVDKDQVLELKPQDVVLPCCPENPEESADQVLFNAAKFVDDLLVNLYGVEPFFRLGSKQELVGQLVIGLAPHTSAGILGRVIGFSQTQGFLAHPYFHAAMRRDCDGDESCFLLLMDAFLNFSRQFLPESRGSTMDAPLVLTSVLTPSEVDDMAFNVDIAWKYPLEFYKACASYKKPWEVNVLQIKDVLGTPGEFEGMGFTHDTGDINAGVRCSAYKLLPSMEEKMKGQMELAVKLRACDASDVARLVIEKHFIRDTKGNLRKFSQQQYRCVKCNEKFRRPPLRGNCKHCGGKIIFTISEGSVVKYLEPSLSLAKAYNVPIYLQQDLELTKRRIESVFGKEPEIQEGLGKWFG